MDNMGLGVTMQQNINLDNNGLCATAQQKISCLYTKLCAMTIYILLVLSHVFVLYNRLMYHLNKKYIQNLKKGCVFNALPLIFLFYTFIKYIGLCFCYYI